MPFKARYLTRLNSESFRSETACLGEQLIKLLKLIEPDLCPHIWYGGNIDVSFFKTDFLKNYKGFFLKKIGNMDLLKQVVQDVPQFIWGVFLAVKEELQFEDDQIEIGADDEEFRPLNIEGVIIEIRTFDTSNFEIYSDDYQLIRKIADKYSTPILTSQLNS